MYTTSDNPDLDDDEQEGTELVGFIEQKDEDGFRSRTGSVVESRPGSRRASKASIGELTESRTHSVAESAPGMRRDSKIFKKTVFFPSRTYSVIDFKLGSRKTS